LRDVVTGWSGGIFRDFLSLRFDEYKRLLDKGRTQVGTRRKDRYSELGSEVETWGIQRGKENGRWEKPPLRSEAACGKGWGGLGQRSRMWTVVKNWEGGTSGIVGGGDSDQGGGKKDATGRGGAGRKEEGGSKKMRDKCDYTLGERRGLIEVCNFVPGEGVSRG